MRANEKRSFRVVMFSGSNIRQEESAFELIDVFRRLVCQENGLNVDHEFNISDEASSMHVLAYGWCCFTS